MSGRLHWQKNTENMHRDKRKNQFPINLFCSLMLLSFIPFLDMLMRTNLIANIPSTDGLSIAGHMEWFDLINETIQAFLIVPLFALFNKCIGDTDKLKERIFQSFLIVNTIYIIFSIIVLLHCSYIVSVMTSENIPEVTGYLKLETIGFIIENVVNFISVLFIVLEKPFYIYTMVILKTVFTIIGDLFLIPQFGVNGVAFSNIAVNAVCVVMYDYYIQGKFSCGFFPIRQIVFKGLYVYWIIQRFSNIIG